MRKLQRGEIVWAIVEEVHSSTEMLCSFEGKLLLLSNQSRRVFKPGDRVKLQVRAVEPLSFQIFSDLRFERLG
ncbi:hypothetical protein BDW_02165 [Bdellovibrio bacteriovorus W]|nr:hypothetical protein BDW_02165 [Bdellovibrio bacteriovorus W]